MRPLITIAIPTYTRTDLLERCLEALSTQTIRTFEVVIVDNASPIPVSTTLANQFDAVTIIRMSRNRFFAAAANAGLARARTPFVAVLNDDTVPEPRWLESALSAFDEHPATGSVASKVLRFDNPAIIDSAGDLLAVCGHATNRGWGDPDGPEFDVPTDVFSASGSCAVYRRTAFVAAGGFDSSFHGYLEDVDLGFRLQLLGYRCRYEPQAIVRHHGGGTPKRRHFALWLTERNMVLNLAKNMPTSLLKRYWPAILHAQSRPAPISGGGTWVAWAYGKLAASLQWASLVARRRHIQATRRVPDDVLDSRLVRALFTHCHL